MTISVAFLVWRHPSPNEFVWNNRSSIFIKKWQHYHAPWLLICNKLTKLFIAIQFNCCPPKNWQTKINLWIWHELCFALLTYSFHFTNKFWKMIFFHWIWKTNREIEKFDKHKKKSSKRLKLCSALFTYRFHFTSIFERENLTEKCRI